MKKIFLTIIILIVGISILFKVIRGIEGLKAHERVTSGNFAVANNLLIRIIQENRVDVYATKPCNSKSIKVDDFIINFIFNDKLVVKYRRWDGHFIAHYNESVWVYAAYLYKNRSKRLAFEILKALAEADPSIRYSRVGKPNVPIATYLTEITKDMAGMPADKEMINDPANQWEWRRNAYANQ